MVGLNSQSRDRINKIVEDLFDTSAILLLGAIPSLIRKKPTLLGFAATLGLVNLFVQAMNNKSPNVIEEDVLKSVLDGANNYINVLKNKTSNDIIQRIEGLARESKLSADKIPEEELQKILQEEMKKARSNLQKIVMAESTKTRNLGSAMNITRFAAMRGESDPTVAFMVIKDKNTCEECIRVNLMEDGITPRVYKMSELSAGYFKRGDKVPSLNGQHPHCFTGNQKIATELGLFTFKELFESQFSPKVLVDYRIKNKIETGNQFGKPIPGIVRLDPHSKNDSRFEQATSVYDTGVQEVIRLTMDTGHELEVSLGHEMWTETGNSKWEKVTAEKLIIGDKVPLITKAECFGTDHFPVEAELMGNLLGDGTFVDSTNTAQFNFFGNDIPYGEKLYQLKKEHFSDFKSEENLKIYPPDDKYNVSRATFSSQVLGRIFSKEFGLSKKPRRVPQRLFKADKETVSAFLRGLYAADGCSEENSIQLSQNDLTFLKEIQLLMSMFGFVSRIYSQGEATQKTITYADGTKYVTNRKACWRIFIGGSDQFNRFVDQIGFGVPFKQQKAEMQKTETSKIRSYWRTAKIEKIERLGLQQTYCLTEPMTNTVTVNGIVTGQCRCTIFTVPSDWGFDSRGHLEFVGIGHDELKKQRS